MVILNRIYTRTGDDGTTALGSGERRPKYDLRIAAYGTVDETNAAIGVARLHLADTPELDATLAMIQSANMVMQIATNCSSTRARISFCDVFGEPPRIMLTRPSSRTNATAASATGRMNLLRNVAIRAT